MFVLMSSRSSSKLGRLVSKSRSPGQISRKLCYNHFELWSECLPWSVLDQALKVLCCSGERYRAIMALLFFSETVRLGISCESSARQSVNTYCIKDRFSRWKIDDIFLVLLFFAENRILHFVKIFSIFWEKNKKKYLKMLSAESSTQYAKYYSDSLLGSGFILSTTEERELLGICFCVACVAWQTHKDHVFHLRRQCRHRRCRRHTFHFRSITFLGMYWFLSNFAELYITIKYRSSSILVTIRQILAGLWPFFNLVFVVCFFAQ